MTTYPRFALLVLASLALVAPALAQIPPMLPEFQVNEQTYDYQEGNGVAIDKVGRFVVAWSGYDETIEGDLAFGRLYDESGAPQTEEFPFGPPPGLAGVEVARGLTNQSEATVAKDASGRFVAVWQEGASVFARRFDVDGTPLGDRFPVSDPFIPAGSPQVAGDDSGNFVVVWTSALLGEDVAARLFDSFGTPVTDEFIVNAYTTDTQDAGGVTMSAGGFVVSWGGEGDGGPGVFARRFDADGAPLGGDFKVNQGVLLNAVSGSDLATSAAGEFVVVWSGLVPPSYEGIFARLFDAAGQPRGGEFPVSGAATDTQGGARVKSDHAGNFIVAWTHQDGDGDGSGMIARRFDHFGTPITPPFVVNEATDEDQYHANVTLNDAGQFVVTWSSQDDSYYGVFARRSAVAAAAEISVDVPTANVPSAVAENGILEPGETARVETAWVNESASDLVDLAGGATDFSGPGAGNLYVVEAAGAIYGTVPAGASGSCDDTGDCIEVTLNVPASRPVQHWDARLQEALFVGVPHTWMLHIGESFPDVPSDNIFYPFIETLFHNGVTGGCAGGGYCPANPVTRAQMAVFLLKSKFGAAHVRPPCTGTVFPDVPCTGGAFDPWIEELASLGITGGCGGGLYCPNNTVIRQQMAVFLLKALSGSTYVPPACTGVFDDVPCTPGVGFSDWIEELADRGITGGCSVTPPLYCPTNPNNRGQMAAFLTKMFGLVLYGG